MKALREFPEYLRIVVSHCRQSYFVLLKSLLGFLQLDQLLLAERSPVRRAYKQKDQPSHSGQRSQTLLPAELVTGGEGRDLLSNGRASLRNWSGGAAGLRIESRRNQELPRKEEDGPESDIPERFTGNTGDAHDFLFCSPKMSCPGQNYEANRGAGNVRPVIYL
jgi:hypothetical protein